MKALILENSRSYRKWLGSILAQQGFEYDSTDEIQLARELLRDNQYDIICLNDMLKDGSGIDMVHSCKQNKDLTSIPILFLTSTKDFERQLNEYADVTTIIKNDLQQVSHQIIHFLETHLDPVFSDGRILLVEDSKTVTQLVLTALEADGYRVDHYKAADKALEAFTKEAAFGSDQNAYDLIITDILVEGNIDGEELTQKIRAMDDPRGLIPIMAMTALTNSKLRLSLFKLGISDFIQKPILIDEMLVRARNLITNKRLLDKVHDQRRELYTLATTDKLTGCHNRHSLMVFAKKFISQAIRHWIPISVMVIDIDHFKSFNDIYGHSVGDLVLKELGGLLNASFREEDLVSRFGGDEFVILLDQCDEAFVREKAKRLREKIVGLRPHDLLLTASIGVTTLTPGNIADFDTLFNAADEAVYIAKENGRNQMQFLALNDVSVKSTTD